MKFIHTGDWHIGKIINQVHLTEDQAHILRQVVDIARDERPDAIIIAGDIYDRAVPPVEAVELLNECWSQLLLELKIPILAIAGNHDSPDRLSFGGEILSRQGLFVEGRLRREIKPVILSDQFGPVNFYLVPYTHPAIVRDLLQEPVYNHDEAMRAIINGIGASMKRDERNVLITHGFARGDSDLETSDSERPLSIGGAEYFDVHYTSGFDYTALGHLHTAQKVGCERVQYAGAPFKFTFSECQRGKSLSLVEIDGKRKLELRKIPLVPRRDMRIITGRLSELISPHTSNLADSNDYIHAVLTDEGELIDPAARLKAVYPNLLSLERASKVRQQAPAKTAAAAGYRQKSVLDLFDSFYSSITDQEFSQAKTEIIAQAIEAAEHELRGE